MVPKIIARKCRASRLACNGFISRQDSVTIEAEACDIGQPRPVKPMSQMLFAVLQTPFAVSHNPKFELKNLSSDGPGGAPTNPLDPPVKPLRGYSTRTNAPKGPKNFLFLCRLGVVWAQR